MSDEQNNRQCPKPTKSPARPNSPCWKPCRPRVESLKDQRLRALAEAENIRRRAEREKAEASQYAVTKFARDMLGIADNFARALAACPPAVRDAADPQVKAVLDGVEATDRQLLATLERYGVKPVDTERRQVRSQSASGHRRSAGQRQAAGQHRGCGAVRLHDRRPAAAPRHGDGGAARRSAGAGAGRK